MKAASLSGNEDIGLTLHGMVASNLKWSLFASASELSQFSGEEQGRIELALHEVPALVHVDPTLLEQVVQNLVSNALKYSPEGSPVLIDVRRSGASVRISVTDRGVGVPADEVASLFKRFFRARTAQNLPGTGIGLSLVAQVMDLHSGRVDVEGVEGEGSTFSICFPYTHGRVADPAVFRPLEEATS